MTLAALRLTTILLLTASPHDLVRLRLQQEASQDALLHTTWSHEFQVVQRPIPTRSACAPVCSDCHEITQDL
jgi:hypothetical protein